MADIEIQPLDRNGIAARIAQDIPEGWFVNLGIGIPTGVSDFVPMDREVIFHAENGVIGIGPAPAPEDINPFLVNAGVQPITLRTGGAYVHHADSFAIARGGHLDLCVLGAFEVAQNGDIANWARAAGNPRNRSAAPWTWRSAPSGYGSPWSTTPRARVNPASGACAPTR